MPDPIEWPDPAEFRLAERYGQPDVVVALLFGPKGALVARFGLGVRTHEESQSAVMRHGAGRSSLGLSHRETEQTAGKLKLGNAARE